MKVYKAKLSLQWEIGAALGLLAAAAEGVRRSAQAAEQRAARKEELLDKQMKSLTAKPQEWKAAAQAYLAQKALDAFRAQERPSASLPAAGERKSLWQKANEWIQDKVEKFVYHPPSWLSVSYSRPFSLGRATMDEWVSYQPWARGGDLLRSVGYQKVSFGMEAASKLTSNPSGRIDINFSNGRLTFKGTEQEGIRKDWFIQPFALSFGNATKYPDGTIDVTTIDIDLVGVNWASFKISQASGTQRTVIHKMHDGEFAQTTTMLGKVEMSVHRYPRLLVIGGALVLAFKVGVALAPLLVPSIPILQRILQNSVTP